MKKIPLILLAALCALSASAQVQDTNSLKTDLGVFENQIGTVLIKGFSQVGLVTAGTDVITVYCKQSTDIARGHKADGLAIVISGNAPTRKRILVDYDEIDSLLDSIAYLNKISYDVTPLAGFEASYSTRSGFRVVANSLRRQGSIQESLEYGDDVRILLTTDQMTQLSRLFEQAKKNLDTLRNPK
jgi:hypothetical protein